MKKDIPTPEVKDITVVIKPGDKDDHWSVHLVNSSDVKIKNILVASRGYSAKKQVTEKTSVLRHFFDDLNANSSLQIELIDPKVFHLFNEFDVSYYINEQIYYKKFVFVPGSLHTGNLMFDKIMNEEVVIHS